MTGTSAAICPFLFTLNIIRDRTGQWLSQGVGRGFLTVWWFQGLHKNLQREIQVPATSDMYTLDTRTVIHLHVYVRKRFQHFFYPYRIH